MFEILKPSQQGATDNVNMTTRIKWPWRHMGVGDLVKISDKDLAGKAQSRAHVYGMPYGRKFATKNIDGVLHVWRTA
jgi:hypothetical protein